MEKGQLLIEEAKEKIIEKIKKSEVKDDKIIKAVGKMKKIGVKVLRNDKQQIEDKLVLKKGKMYIAKDERLRLEIIWLHHDTLIAEHREQ